jgi:hypothetical protein
VHGSDAKDGELRYGRLRTLVGSALHCRTRLEPSQSTRSPYGCVAFFRLIFADTLREMEQTTVIYGTDPRYSLQVVSRRKEKTEWRLKG